MATQQETNRTRHDKNLELLTGRHNCKFMQNGQPRGGDGHATIEELVLHEAVLIPIEEVLDEHGLNDTGERTPYEKLHPATVIRPIRRETIFSAGGRPIKTTETALDA